ncbi:hypothetical protein D3C81_09410 [compost metagenome]
MRVGQDIKKSIFAKITKSLDSKELGTKYYAVVGIIQAYLNKNNSLIYEMYKKEDVYCDLGRTHRGLVFRKWADQLTLSIDKDFNKGRKVTRTLKDLYMNYKDVLPSCFSCNSLPLLVECMFLDYELLELNGEDIVDKKDFEDTLAYLGDYVAALLAVGLFEGVYSKEYIIGLFIEMNTQDTIPNVLGLGVVTDIEWYR